MSKKYKKEKIILIVLVLVIIAINYPFLDNLTKNIFIEYETGIVERVIDGDTVKINNESVRLLGINSPEKGEKYSTEAKEFLEKEILNKTVEIRFGKEKYDRYSRKLGYIFLKGKNINLKIVEEGLANFYFPSGKDVYYPKFYSAWESCLEKEINLCVVSTDICSKCVIMKEWNIKEQYVLLENNCEFDCDISGWSIKDEGRKKFIFENFVLKKENEIKVTHEDFNKDYVWTETGDTIYIRDKNENIILWENY